MSLKFEITSIVQNYYIYFKTKIKILIFYDSITTIATCTFYIFKAPYYLSAINNKLTALALREIN